MTITIGTRYDSRGKTTYHTAVSDDDPELIGTGDTVEAAMLDLEEMMREEYHPDRTPRRLHAKEARFQRNHEREP